ncbi:arylsulfatase [Flammeovirga sp. OC4]|uniref:arylsulfatase n=1 Tax=Flammeovirga sp. OC4 TaxID=1382345 RepID=UPI0005C74E06|nr:arylsulfatase [Flammeovirga sp. OC4]
MKTTSDLIKLLPILLLLSFSCSVKDGNRKSELPKKPNIIVILADDMGFSDLGCTGGEINTPNLDQLASDGTLFTNFYNTPRCAPSRASLLTGLYAHQTGVGHLVEDWGKPGYKGYLSKNTVTVAEVLKENGYHTIMSGKWHLGDDQEHWPNERGFEDFYGIPAGGGVYFYPTKFLNREVYKNGVKTKENPDTFYSTNNFTDEAIQFIDEAKGDHKPFFLYMAQIAPHFPLQALPEDIEKYKGKYEVGYEAIREKRFAKQKALGIFPENLEITEGEHPKWNELKDTKAEAHKMSVYAAQVDRLDQNIGKLMDYLKQEKMYDNTVIFFLSDNGGCHQMVNRSKGVTPGGRDSFESYGHWANVSNTPFKLWKRETMEGGIRTPFIAHFPKSMKVKKGLNTQPAHIIDVMTTCLELAGASYPTSYQGNTIYPTEGESILTLARGEETDQDRMLFWEHEGNKGLRQGDWKMVKRRKSEWMLFNMKSDPLEEENIIDQYPEKASKYTKAYQQWMTDHFVEEWPAKKKKNKKKLN